MMENNRLESTASHRSRISSAVCLQSVHGSWSRWVGHLTRRHRGQTTQSQIALMTLCSVSCSSRSSRRPQRSARKQEARERHAQAGAVMSLPTLDVMRQLVLYRGSSVFYLLAFFCLSCLSQRPEVRATLPGELFTTLQCRPPTSGPASSERTVPGRVRGALYDRMRKTANICQPMTPHPPKKEDVCCLCDKDTHSQTHGAKQGYKYAVIRDGGSEI